GIDSVGGGAMVRRSLRSVGDVGRVGGEEAMFSRSRGSPTRHRRILALAAFLALGTGAYALARPVDRPPDWPLADGPAPPAPRSLLREGEVEPGSDSGRFDARSKSVCSNGTSSISPCPGNTTAYTGRVLQSAVFTINNLTIEPIAYVLGPSCTGAVNTCAGPSSVTIQAGQSKQVTVTYSTASTPGSGVVSLMADDGFSQITG